MAPLQPNNFTIHISLMKQKIQAASQFVSLICVILCHLEMYTLDFHISSMRNMGKADLYGSEKSLTVQRAAIATKKEYEVHQMVEK